MRLRNGVIAAIGLSIAIAAPSRAQRPASDSLAAIAFDVEPSVGGASGAGTLPPFAGTVRFAQGRGRIDIVSVDAWTPVAIGRMEMAPMLARPGDYYLFDSTSVTVVHPSARTFTRIALGATEYNFTNGRTGWPDFFEFAPTIPRDPNLAGATSHDSIPIFWHLDTNQGTPSSAVLSRGRWIVRDAPFGDASVIRWIGPAFALGRFADSVSSVPSSIGITAVAVLIHAQPSALNLITVHPMSNARSTRIARGDLELPRGFTEVSLAVAVSGSR